MLKILIVEDHLSFRTIFKMILEHKWPDIIISEAQNGAQAMQKVEQESPDLIFMDIDLPDASGLELTRRIKANHPDISIFVITNYDEAEYSTAAKLAGAEHLFHKDAIDFEKLKAFIDDLIARTQG